MIDAEGIPDLQQARERAFDTLLEEASGGPRPPDLRGALSAREAAPPPRPGARLLMAAVLLLGAGVVTTLAWRDGAGGAAETADGGSAAAPGTAEQDPRRLPLEPESVEALGDLLLQARGYRLRVYSDRRVAFDATPTWHADPFVEHPALQTERESTLPSFRMLASHGLQACATGTWGASHRFEVVVDGDGDFLRLRLHPERPVLRVQGLGDVRIDPRDAAWLRDRIREVGRRQRWSAGELFGAELAAVRDAGLPLPADGVLRLHDATRAQLATLAGEHVSEWLQELDLSPSTATLGRGGLAELPVLPRLETLTLHGHRPGEGELLALHRQPGLRVLDLSGLQAAAEAVTRDVFALLRGSGLQRLVLARAELAALPAGPVEIAAPRPPAGVRPLELDLSHLSFGRGLQAHLLAVCAEGEAAGSGVRLTALRAQATSGLDDAGLLRIAMASPALRRLDVRDCGALTPGGVAAVLDALPLRELRCRGLEVDAELLEALRARGGTLESLELSVTGARITAVDAATCAVLAELSALRELELSGHDGFGDDGLRAFARAPRLQRLVVRGCDGITAAGVAALQAARPDVDVVGFGAK